MSSTPAIAGLQTCSIRSTEAAKLTVVFLHGYGMSPSDLTPFAHSLAIPGAAYVFPQAPLATAGGGHAWWSIPDRERPADCAAPPRDLAEESFAGRETARVMVGELIAALLAQGQGEPLLLAGFSQGGMLACDSVLLDGTRVAGLALMSSSCIAIEEWRRRKSQVRDLPAFVSHGRADPDLAFSAGERLRQFLTSGGAAVTWVPFDGGHEIPFQVWRQFRAFARGTLNDSLTH